MTVDQILADNRKMERFICDRLPADRTRIAGRVGRTRNPVRRWGRRKRYWEMSESNNKEKPMFQNEIHPAVPSKIDHLQRIKELIKSGDTAHMDHWGEGKFVLGEDGKWHYEGFVGLLKALHEAMRAVDPSMPPGLPPHCLDPEVIAKFFRIPLEKTNWPGKSKPEPPKVDSPYLTISEGAAYLRTTVQGIYSLVKRGRLHPMPGRGKLLFTRQALDRCMTTRRRRR